MTLGRHLSRIIPLLECLLKINYNGFRKFIFSEVIIMLTFAESRKMLLCSTLGNMRSLKQQIFQGEWPTLGRSAC